MDSYATKVNRKKLVNGYSHKSKLVFVDHILEDTDYIAVRDTDKATLFHTSPITPKVTKNSSGIQVYTLKKNSSMSTAMPKEKFITDDLEYYRTDKIPSTGHFKIEKDKSANRFILQLSL